MRRLALDDKMHIRGIKKNEEQKVLLSVPLLLEVRAEEPAPL